MNAVLDAIANGSGLLGLIGLAGLIGLRHPVDRSQPRCGNA